MFIDFKERGEGGGEEKRNIHMRGKHWIDLLPPVCALTGDWTLNLLVYKTMLQGTEPAGQGQTLIWLSILANYILTSAHFMHKVVSLSFHRNSTVLMCFSQVCF